MCPYWGCLPYNVFYQNIMTSGGLGMLILCHCIIPPFSVTFIYPIAPIVASILSSLGHGNNSYYYRGLAYISVRPDLLLHVFLKSIIHFHNHNHFS